MKSPSRWNLRPTLRNAVVVHPEFLGNPPQPAQAEPAPTPTVEPMTETVVMAAPRRSVSQW